MRSGSTSTSAAGSRSVAPPSRCGARRWTPRASRARAPTFAELTGLYRTDPTSDQLKTWPTDLRIIARREPHTRVRSSRCWKQYQGYRFQLTATNLTSTDLQLTGNDVQLLETVHRVHARVESRIRCGKDTDLRRMPS
jgi:hypothetical protein